MSKIIPFAALLPKHDLASKIVSPPYDVISSDEARVLSRDNPHSLLHITKAEVDFPEGTSEYDERVYARARENFGRFVASGWLAKGPESLYIYRIEHRGHVQTGVVCGASVDEYDSGPIRRHEKTRIAKEDDRTKFALAIGAHAEPVLFACRSRGALKGLIKKESAGPPLYDVTGADGARHILWRAGSAGELVRAFDSVEALYIADGHHRSAAASRVREDKRRKNPSHTGSELYNFFPVVVFLDDEVRVYRYDWEGDPAKRPLADVTIADIMKLADEGGIMPPKSTWFAPKLLSGLFIYTF